ncbi:DeoR/GlpR family DNA-binding transcription regulator [Octadecabacter ascidiaceicola]|uniref:Glycerol-3-phosphate regulon repressor n=1 Tax=Octadecabacter ascidiaceicola TaxID=1655543 RepID=A0A238KEN8_9RHOB|nr:DeoR/GlpR family DNA-binding transcription regulator [Octadecabacter ascidiaceicola]SMX40466.1 Glycerol-3-phosphate regulon repressor [Octadecabacter ascidiaceicola]
MSFRHSQILDRARQDGKVSVEGLAGAFDVTLQTIRRDLRELTEQGRLVRVHGGAVLPSGLTNIRYEERRRLNDDAKARIGIACAAGIQNGTSIFLGIGTTCEAIARALVHHDGLMVVTNNLNAVPILSNNRHCKVIVTGGNVRPSDAGLIGAQAATSVRQFKLDTAIIGCSALDENGGIYDYDLDEVIVSQAAIESSHTTILAADHSKFERKAPARIAAISDLSVFCTDKEPRFAPSMKLNRPIIA